MQIPILQALRNPNPRKKKSYEKHRKHQTWDLGHLSDILRSAHFQLSDSEAGMGTVDQVQAPATIPTFLLLRTIWVCEFTQGPAEGEKTAEERKWVIKLKVQPKHSDRDTGQIREVPAVNVGVDWWWTAWFLLEDDVSRNKVISHSFVITDYVGCSYKSNTWCNMSLINVKIY